MGRVARLPLYPLLLAAYAVLFVYAQNLGEVLPVDVMAPLVRSLLGAGAVLAVAALVYRSPRRGALVAAMLVLAFAFFGQLGSQASRLGLDEPAQLILWVVAIALVAIYAAVAKGSLEPVTVGLNAFVIVLVALSLTAIVPAEMGRVARAAPRVASEGPPIPTATRVPNRDIYFLIFDRYGSNWSLNERFGFTSDLPDWLASKGFQVIPGARTSYRATDFSIASMLTMDWLDDLTRTIGPISDDRTPARAKIPYHAVGRFLQANGYRYYQLGAWYEPTQSSPIADDMMVYGKTTEFEAVLHDASIMPVLERFAGQGPADTEFRDRHRNENLFELREIERLAGVPGRKFVFAHVLLPHPPYVFHADGSPILEAEAQSTPEGDLYKEQMTYVNGRIRHLVDALTAGPDDQDPIIVITGDEGPFLCGDVDCVDGTPHSLGIRFGVLRAYFLPGLDYTVPSDDTGVNVFRMLFREYFGTDTPDLPNRSYNWPDNDHLYDFIDVTDALPLPGGH